MGDSHGTTRPPAGWVNVPYNDGNVATCAALLAGSSADSSQPTANCLNTLLSANYTDLNAFGAGVSTTQPLFYLYYRAVTVNTALCVAFYKTLKTSGGSATSLFSQPTRRWWCITLGVKPTPATGWSYPYVRDLCSYFYYQIMNPAIGDALVVAEDHNRHASAGSIEADACSKLLAGDALIVKTPLVSAESAYYPWSNVRHLKPGKQMDFVQLTF